MSAFHGAVHDEIARLFREAARWAAWRGHTPVGLLFGVGGFEKKVRRDALGFYTFRQGTGSSAPWGDASRFPKQTKRQDPRVRRARKTELQAAYNTRDRGLEYERRLRAGERPKSWGKAWRAAAERVGIKLIFMRQKWREELAPTLRDE